MEIIASDGRFLVGALRVGDWQYEWNKDGTLSIWGKRDIRVHVTTYRGDFIQLLDAEDHVLCEGGDGEWFCIEVAKEKRRLRFKKLPDPQLSASALNKARQRVTRYLLSEAPYSCDLPDTLNGVIKWMQKKLAEIPEASRAKASFRFDTTMEYGETYPRIEISYTEPETDDEVIKRVQIERERARIAEGKEREQLSRLRKKFADS